MLSFSAYVLIFAATVAASAVNALAGGGTLITFPVLVGLGVPSVAANMTNTVALCPGYLGGTLSQRQDLVGQERRLRWIAPIGVIGGLAGGILLQVTTEAFFRALIPYLILLATALLAAQPLVRAWVSRLQAAKKAAGDHPGAFWAVAVASVYGGYFGAGLGVMVLAVLALAIDDSLRRLNALKQVVALTTNVAAAAFFAFSGKVVWTVAAVMFVASLLGGSLGGNLAGRIQPDLLRHVVVAIGLGVAILYFVR